MRIQTFTRSCKYKLIFNNNKIILNLVQYNNSLFYNIWSWKRQTFNCDGRFGQKSRNINLGCRHRLCWEFYIQRRNWRSCLDWFRYDLLFHCFFNTCEEWERWSRVTKDIYIFMETKGKKWANIVHWMRMWRRGNILRT